MDNKLIENIVNEILKNEKFKNECKNSINAVLKDGQLDMADTPHILNLVVEIINNTNQFKITKDKIEGVLKVLLLKLLEEMKLLTDENKEITEKLINSSLKLLLTKIKQSKVTDKIKDLLKKMISCKCSCCKWTIEEDNSIYDSVSTTSIPLHNYN